MILFLLLNVSTLYAADKQITGWIEEVSITSEPFKIHAKMDSGAKNSSINAPDLEIITKDNEQWANFSITNRKGERKSISAKIVGVAKIRRAGCEKQVRHVIELDICLGNVSKRVLVNLVDRGELNYQMLIGRNFVQNNFLIDVSQKYIQPLRCTPLE